ncbi:hypothetical protein [Nonomuraea sp. NPDC049784]|uniref:hypothetical protein n=1 Tax=Nonomuraea sp. NPDC049784 TaxID=3154361 RepID=UPI0033F1AC7E
MEPDLGRDEHLPADLSADLYRLLEAGWAVTGLQPVDGEAGPAYLISASAGEWSLLSAYPRNGAIEAEWSASLYRGQDEYVIIDRDEFTAIASGTRNDLMRAWATKEHQLLVPDENEDGPTSDDSAGSDGIQRISYAGFMTIRGSTAVYTELHRRKQQFGRYVIRADDLLALDEGSFIEVS